MASETFTSAIETIKANAIALFIRLPLIPVWILENKHKQTNKPTKIQWDNIVHEESAKNVNKIIFTLNEVFLDEVSRPSQT